MTATASSPTIEIQGGRQPSAARTRILQTADRLFYNEGIHAVGVHRIVKEAGVTRVTLYRHFPSKDDLISAYLGARAEDDRTQVLGLAAANPGNPRRTLTELATVLIDTDFAAVRRGCPFINSAAEFTEPHPARTLAQQHRIWVTRFIEGLLIELGHRTPATTAQQMMMIRTGAVVSAAFDDNWSLNADFLVGWETLIDAGL